MAASPERAAFVQQEFRSATFQSSQVKDWYGKVARDTKDDPFVSFFSDIASAEKYLLERGLLLGRHVRRFRTVVDGILTEADIDVSTVVPGAAIIDADLGADMICGVIAIEALDLENERTTLNLWGAVGQVPAYEEIATGGVDQAAGDGGLGTAAGAGATVAPAGGAGSTSGTGDAEGVGASVKAGAGAAAGVGADGGAGGTVGAGAGAAAGVGDVEGAGVDGNEAGGGESTGTGTAAGAGASIDQAAGTAAGGATDSGTGEATAGAVGSAAGAGDASATGQAAGSDPNWANVELLVSFDGADGSTTFTDSTGKHTLTPSGQVQIDTDQSKFGGSSGLFDGTGDYLTVSDQAAFSVANATDFTIEGWINLADVASIHTICAKRPSSSAHEFSIYVSAGGSLTAEAYRNGGGVVAISISHGGLLSALSASSWYHFALTRESGTWRLFADGQLADSAAQSNTPSASSQALLIGRQAFNTGRDFKGWIDELRITMGVARYTANFTPPTAPFPTS